MYKIKVLIGLVAVLLCSSASASLCTYEYQSYYDENQHKIKGEVKQAAEATLVGFGLGAALGPFSMIPAGIYAIYKISIAMKLKTAYFVLAADAYSDEIVAIDELKGMFQILKKDIEKSLKKPVSFSRIVNEINKLNTSGALCPSKNRKQKVFKYSKFKKLLIASFLSQD
jgi:hypothetical protein